MSTTNLFVELIVIGVGAAGWLALLIVAGLGYNPTFLRQLASTPAAAVPGLACIYLLGIVTDRLADATLHVLRAERKRVQYFATEDQCLAARGYVLANSAYFAAQFDYSRSRQRICRGWILNALMLAIGLNVFLLVEPRAVAHPGRLSAVATPMLLLLAAACWYSWERLADTELKRIRDEAELLHEMQSQKPVGA